MPGGRVTKIGGVCCYTAEASQVSVTLIQTGVGIQNALTVGGKVLGASQWDLAISSGFAGALIPSCIGALVLPNTVVLKPLDMAERVGLSPFPCSVEYHRIVSQVVEMIQPHLVSGVLVTVPWIVWSVTEKRALAETFQASALDMESAGIAEKATEQKIPFLVIRTVSDLKDENLPEEFNLFLSPSTWVLGVWRIISQPASWTKVFQLRQHMKVASRQLTSFFDTFFLYLGQQEHNSSQG